MRGAMLSGIGEVGNRSKGLASAPDVARSAVQEEMV